MAEQKYDVVVIGGGMGGMCAGALAVKEGLRTLVLEKRPMIGGRFSTETIDGFKIMTGSAIHSPVGMGAQSMQGSGSGVRSDPVSRCGLLGERRGVQAAAGAPHERHVRDLQPDSRQQSQADGSHGEGDRDPDGHDEHPQGHCRSGEGAEP